MKANIPTITLASPTDLPDILDMVQKLSELHGDQARVTQAKLHDIFFGATSHAVALIARINGAAVGYAGMTKVMVLHDGDARLDIQHLFVQDGRRGQRIGAGLIEAAKQYALKVGATRLTIGTDAGNATAIAAYRAMDILEEITGAGPRFFVDLSK